MPLLRVIFALLISAALWGNGPARGDEVSRFADDVLPLLASKCLSCHGPDQQDGELRLDSLSAARAGGARGPAVVPGDPGKSLLVQAISFGNPDLQMPPKQKLSQREIDLLVDWIRAGAIWPEPPVVLFEEDVSFPGRLTQGNGTARLVTEAPYSGRVSLEITPLQRDAASIPGWHFPIREHPGTGEYRFLRLAWKKRGGGSVMLELASQGKWPAADNPKGRYVAGPNTTGWSAISVGAQAPTEWSVQTFDLWKDMGEFTLTGCAPTCDGGTAAYFDAMLLGPSLASLDAYRPHLLDFDGATPLDWPGDAFTDARNPIRKLFRGERLDLWSLKPPGQTNFSIPGDRQNSRQSEPDYEEPHESRMIDDIVVRRLEAAGLAASPAADRRTIIRRLTFDLTGLPPTPEEVAAFLADSTPNAYALLVDRLLASPRYGEQQARAWLDVVRYADTQGYERDEFRPLAWQYRDYVVRSFNSDKPFDQFVREQLAGDEMVPSPPRTLAEADALIATGFLRLGQWDSTASIFQEEDRLRAEILADLTNTTASAFLGMTMSCCQCHDHKYDPLSQADHYRMQAFFSGFVPSDDVVIELAQDLEGIKRHNASVDAKLEPLRAEEARLQASAEQHKEQIESLKREMVVIESEKQSPRLAMGGRDSGPVAPPTYVLYQGDFQSPREEVQPGFVSVLSPGPAPILPPHEQTTGRRLALAQWIASPENPWTARVIVNRIWQQHFGTGLVATPNDLGYTGAPPTHPELLDWLATRFVAEGWSIKKLHRWIVHSATYRQASRVARESSPGEVVESGNALLWRQNMRRLDAETIRDSLLSVSGLLRDDASGKPVWPEVPADLLNAQPAILEALEGKDGGRMQGWYTDPVEQTDVRSLFLVRKRCLPIPFLQVFDLPDTTVSCARRDTTVVAPQALTLLNSPEGIRCAEAFARRVAACLGQLEMSQPDSRRQATVVAFRLALTRDPGATEIQLADDLLRRHFDQYRQEGREQPAFQSLFDLCRGVLNLNEFVYVD